MAHDEERGFRAELEREEDYRFRVEFDGDGAPALFMDEPPPLGHGEGPNATRILGAAVGHCLSASLLFCLDKARVEVGDVKASVTGTLTRNERGRLRVAKLAVELAPRVPRGQMDRMKRCLEIFEDYCVVTESVRGGFQVDVTVSPVESPETEPVLAG